MDVKPCKLTQKKIKPFLIFFCLAALLTACQPEKGIDGIHVNYTNGVAISLGFESDYDPVEIKLFVSGEIETPVLGKIGISEKGYEFTPAIPFRPGQTYEIRRSTEKLDSFVIKAYPGSGKPRVVQMYPSRDSVPENLLKIYIQFSMPMQEVGNALDFIRVTDKSEGKPVAVFLPLESELWNTEHDLLTLWLDPGRIKTGLIPNMTLGLPLTAGHTYSIEIAKEWKSATGLPLEEAYEKVYHVGKKDMARPDIIRWGLQVPLANSREPLQLSFPESLDAFLLMESLSIHNDEGRHIEGTYQLDPLETSITYFPLNRWHKGDYIILVDSRLEDLAGNNLARLFDEELEGENSIPTDTEPIKLVFTLN